MLRQISIAACIAALIGLVGAGIEAHRMGPPPLHKADTLSVTVLDRDDALLRAYTTPDGRWRLPVTAADVDPIYLRMLLAFEDRRFYAHMGIDPLGYVRIAFEVARHGRLVSGGSTLTMQAARLLDETHEKTARGKVRQMLRALQLEARLTKTEILNLYLRLAPFGGNVEGVRAASLAYFGKEPRRLSYAEAALLVALPQSPNTRRPDKFPQAARRARDKVLRHSVAQGILSNDDAQAAMRQTVSSERRTPPQLAAHLADAEVQAAPTQLVHRTTLNGRLQAALEGLAREHVKTLGQGLSAAIIAIDHTTGETVGYVGSAGFLDADRQGAVDMARAVRSPGSTLKPLIYGLAFDAGLAHPETLIEDRPTRFGTYVPKNFDHDWHGTVTIREALAKSLNIPAVKVLEAVGPAKLHARMTALGLNPQLPRDAEPSLALALGGVGLKPTELAAIFAAIARGGSSIPITHRRNPATEVPLCPTATDAEPRRTEACTTTQPRVRLMSETAAFYLTDVLKNAPPPTNARAGQIAYKTGTSYGYRDAWSAGFDGRHTLVVWVGRPDGSPVAGLSGRQSAAPLLFDAFQRIAERRVPLAAAPRGWVRQSTSELAPTLRRFGDSREGLTAGAFRSPTVAIAFPPDKSEIEADPSDGDAVIVKADGGTLPLTWMVDGTPIASDPSRREATLVAAGRGFIKLSVIDALGRTDRVTVRLK
jgi:penicillin-binding protein 1C